MRLLSFLSLCWALSAASVAFAMAPTDGKDDLRPIAEAQWSAASAAHLLQRAGFGGRPDEIAALTALGPREAVRQLVRWQSVGDNFVAFDPSDLHDPSLEPVPASRPATTDAAKRDALLEYLKTL